MSVDAKRSQMAHPKGGRRSAITVPTGSDVLTCLVTDTAGAVETASFAAGCIDFSLSLLLAWSLVSSKLMYRGFSGSGESAEAVGSPRLARPCEGVGLDMCLAETRKSALFIVKG